MDCTFSEFQIEFITDRAEFCIGTINYKVTKVNRRVIQSSRLFG